jgi:hypothetical protein
MHKRTLEKLAVNFGDGEGESNFLTSEIVPRRSNSLIFVEIGDYSQFDSYFKGVWLDEIGDFLVYEDKPKFD